jgi:LPXTG-site transpeptidase (sortase) family protein
MSLKLPTNWKVILKWVGLAIAAILLTAFFVRVVTWEDWYYREKEGSERVVTTETEDEQEELDETVPTEEEVREYIVEPDLPRYLSIPALGISNARVLQVGVDNKGQVGTPRNVFDVGWYQASGKPGQGKTMLIDGHNGGPHVYGVFKNLPDLEAGDIIIVERGDGVVFKYSVVENNEVPLSSSDSYMAKALRSPESGKESLTLISCSGEWSQSQGTYLSRQFVRAVLVQE